MKGETVAAVPDLSGGTQNEQHQVERRGDGALPDSIPVSGEEGTACLDVQLAETALK